MWSRDRAAKRGYPKSVVLLWLLRVAQAARAGPAKRIALYPLVGSAHKLLSEWLLGVEIPPARRSAPASDCATASVW